MKTHPLSFLPNYVALLLLLLLTGSCKKTTDTVTPSEPYITAFSPTQASEGDELLVQGAGFKKTPLTFTVNGVPATSVSVLSETQLKVIVPDGATTGKLSIASGGVSNQSANDLTIVLPISAKATVTKLAGIPAYPTNGADGVRLDIGGDYNLLITGPGSNQQVVYKLDIKTLGITPLLTNLVSPTGIYTSGYELVVGGRNAFYYYPDYTKPGTFYTNAYTNAVDAPLISLKLGIFATANKYRYVATSYSNQILGFVQFSNGSYTTTVLNTQLKGIPNDASAMLAVTSKNIYVSANQAIWKLGSDNKLTVIAGSPGEKGYADGSGTAARFSDGGYARGMAIAVNELENVIYAADYGCGCIRKIDGLGNVTTVAGRPTASAKTGPGNQMRFNFDSWDIALNNDGTLYVIANNDVSSPTLRFAVYKVVFTK